MQTIRRKAEQQVTGLDLRSGQEAFSLHRADDETRQIVLAFGVHARHFGGFAANQGAAIVPAAPCDTLHHIGAHLRLELTHRKVVQKEKRRRPLHGNIIDAVVHQILAHGVVPPGSEGNLELGADPVR